METYRQRRAFGLTGVIVSLVVLWYGVLACSSDKFYYADRADPVSAIMDTYGSPQLVEVRPDGAEKLIYLIRDHMSGNYYRRYFIVKNGKVISGGIE